jgi:hypothetical protein
VLEIEEFRCSLPLNDQDDDVFPIGFCVNFNCTNPIDFANHGKQPASPLVLILNDEGFLSTFFAVNLDARNKSACKPASPMKYVAQAPSVQPQLQPTVSFAAPQPQPKPAPVQTQAPSPQFNQLAPQPQPQQQNQQALQFLLQQQQQQQHQNQLAAQLLLQQQQMQQQLQKQAIQHQQQQQQQQQHQQQQLLMQRQAAIQAFQQQQKAVQVQAQQMQNVQSGQGADTNARIREFCRELDEFKVNVNKLFNGKDLSKELVNLSIIKETKKIIEKYNKINEDMKVIVEN